MKIQRLLLGLTLGLISVLQLHAQGERKIVKGEDGSTYIHHYFVDSEQISTTRFSDKTHAKGWAAAYNEAGNEIYKREISHGMINSNVKFSYHSNGAVKQAVFTSAPDGGIQRTEEISHFNEDGEITMVEDRGGADGGFAELLKGGTSKAPKGNTTKSKKGSAEEVRARTLHKTELVVENRSSRPVTLNLKSMGNTFFLMSDEKSITLEPGETKTVHSIENPGSYAPVKVLDFEMEARRKKWLKNLKFDSNKPEEKQKEEYVKELRYKIEDK